MSRLPDSIRPADLTPVVHDAGTRHKYRQLSRILLHLRNDLHLQQPQLAMPTSNMLEQLVYNCPANLLNSDDWQQSIIRVLEYLLEQLHPRHDLTPGAAWQGFLRYDNRQPLFPNDELFDPHDAYLFAQTLLLQQRQYFS